MIHYVTGGYFQRWKGWGLIIESYTLQHLGLIVQPVITSEWLE